jgi:C4-dicarboxylate transporter DctM subunit
MAEGGISRKLFNVFAYIVGKRTGGMPCAVLLTCLFYSMLSGSGPATTAAVGSMSIPFLIELGYNRRFRAGIVAVSGGLGLVTPPSIAMVLYSLATGVSLSQLFLAGIIPGVFITLCLIVYTVIYCRIKGEDTEKIAAKVDELRKNSFIKLLKDSFCALS